MISIRDKITEILNLPNPHDRGKHFEIFLAQQLPKIPDAEISECWRWTNAPEEVRMECAPHAIGRGDFGIDIIARRTDGSFLAIQAKAYAREKQLSQGEVGGFLSIGALEAIRERWIVCTGGITQNLLALFGDACHFIDPIATWGSLPFYKSLKAPPPKPG